MQPESTGIFWPKVDSIHFVGIFTNYRHNSIELATSDYMEKSVLNTLMSILRQCKDLRLAEMREDLALDYYGLNYSAARSREFCVIKRRLI